MREVSRELRDRAVWVLSRLSLAMLLALMAALFLGSAAEGQTSGSSVVQDQAPTRVGMLEGASPVGIVLVSLVVLGGLGVLAFGALKPRRRHYAHDLVDLLRD
jgi:hypothetical protein